MSLDALIAADFFDEGPDAEQCVIDGLSDPVHGGEDRRALDVVRETRLSLWEAHCNLGAAAQPWRRRFPPWPGQRFTRSAGLFLAVNEFDKKQAQRVATLQQLIEQWEP